MLFLKKKIFLLFSFILGVKYILLVFLFTPIQAIDLEKIWQQIISEDKTESRVENEDDKKELHSKQTLDFDKKEAETNFEESKIEEQSKEIKVYQFLPGEWFSYVAETNEGSLLVVDKHRTMRFYRVRGYLRMPLAVESSYSVTKVFIQFYKRLMAYSFSSDLKTLTLNTSSLDGWLQVTSPTLYTKKLEHYPNTDGVWFSQDKTIRATFSKNYFKLEKKIFGEFHNAVDGTFKAFGKSLLLTTQHVRDENLSWVERTHYHGAEYILEDNILTLSFSKLIRQDLQIENSLILFRQ